MVGRTGYSPDQAATYPVLYFPKTSSCKHPLTVAMKSTKCSVLNTHTTQKTQDSRHIRRRRIYSGRTGSGCNRTIRIPASPLWTLPQGAHTQLTGRGANLRLVRLEPAKSRLARRSRCIRRRAGGGCKIHGSVSRLTPWYQVLIRYPIELYKAQNFQNRTYSKPHTRLTRVEKDHVLGPAEKDTTRPTIVYRGRRPWHLLPNCANQYGMA